MHDILIITNLSSGYDRLLLRGIIRFSQECGCWRIHRVSYSQYEKNGDEFVLDLVEKWNVRAVIGRLTMGLVYRLRGLNVVVMAENFSVRQSDISIITGNYIGAGEMAAKYLLSKGYKSFAFVGTDDTIWSRERREGYEGYLYRSNPRSKVQVFIINEALGDGIDGDLQERLADWLRSLPSNTAIFACDDEYALLVTDTCSMFNMAVPDRFAVLGVDNDHIFCHMSNPNLSSIVLNVEEGGYNAAKAVNEMINSGVPDCRVITIEPERIKERGSTNQIFVSDKITKDVLDVIGRVMLEGYFMSGMMETIFTQLPYSRRVCERHFKEATGDTIYNFILKKHMESIAVELLETKKSLKEIMDEFEYFEYSSFCRRFKGVFGVTPVQYRKNNKKITH